MKFFMKNLKLWCLSHPDLATMVSTSISLPFEPAKQLPLLASPQLHSCPYLPVTREIKVLSNSFFVSLIRQFARSMRIVLASGRKAAEQTSYPQLSRGGGGGGEACFGLLFPMEVSKQQHCRCACETEPQGMRKEVQSVRDVTPGLGQHPTEGKTRLTWVRTQISRQAYEHRL